MKKFTTALAVAGAAAVTVAPLMAAAPTADAAPYGRVQFSVENSRLVGKATWLPYGGKTCHLFRGLQGPEAGSMGGMTEVAQRYSTRREVTLYSRPMRPGYYQVRMKCLGRPDGRGLRRIIAERDGRVRVTRWGNQPGQNGQGPRGQQNQQGPRGQENQQGPRGQQGQEQRGPGQQGQRQR
ncbi:MAG: hypothetical protein QM728_01040 [Gordonia sp. (in: high G+C Gram-positive bacteria)]|uniref:hypothetical protein n=1 Tax=Gordonia sp. (in: high G+C Gram-positive bacteria) TaxID=84139 RepID=UPI0039E245E3